MNLILKNLSMENLYAISEMKNFKCIFSKHDFYKQSLKAMRSNILKS